MIYCDISDIYLYCTCKPACTTLKRLIIKNRMPKCSTLTQKSKIIQISINCPKKKKKKTVLFHSDRTWLTVLCLTHYFQLLNSEHTVTATAFSERLCYTCTLNSRCTYSKSQHTLTNSEICHISLDILQKSTYTPLHLLNYPLWGNYGSTRLPQHTQLSIVLRCSSNALSYLVDKHGWVLTLLLVLYEM